MIYYQTEGGPVISDKVSGGERERDTHWMFFREESPTTSPYWLSLNIYPVLWLDLLVLIQVRTTCCVDPMSKISQTSTLSMTEPTQTTTTGSTTSSTEATEQNILLQHLLPLYYSPLTVESLLPTLRLANNQLWTSLKLQDTFHSLLRTSQLLLKLIKGQLERLLEEEALPVRDTI